LDGQVIAAQGPEGVGGRILDGDIPDTDAAAFTELDQAEGAKAQRSAMLVTGKGLGPIDLTPEVFALATEGSRPFNGNVMGPKSADQAGPLPAAVVVDLGQAAQEDSALLQMEGDPTALPPPASKQASIAPWMASVQRVAPSGVAPYSVMK
jgi:hypothetical protein